MSQRKRLGPVRRFILTAIGLKGWEDPVARWLAGDDDTAGASFAGQNVTVTSAIRIGAVFACVRVLAETVASLPIIVYRRKGDSGKERARDHPLYNLLHIAPNRYQTSFEWREMLQGHLALRGNAYCRIIRKAGKPVGLIPLAPTDMHPELADDVPFYRYRPFGQPEEVLLPSEVLHLRFWSDTGLVGLSPITLASRTLGMALAAEEYGSSVYTSGGARRIALSTDASLSPEALKHLKGTWKDEHKNRASVAVLEEGLKAEVIGMNAEDAQFIESRKMTRSEIAGIFRVPPHLIGDLERATFSNITDQTLSFAKYTMLPWLVRWEQALTRALLGDDSEYFIEFLMDGLLRGDEKSRAEVYKASITHGWMNRNEVRALENMNPGPDELDEFLVPLNMSPAKPADEAAPEPVAPPAVSQAPPQDAPADEENRLAPIIANLAGRLARAEMRELEKHVARAGDDHERFLAWLEEFYGKFGEYITSEIAPVIASAGRNGDTSPAIVRTIVASAVGAWGADEAPDLARWREHRERHIEQVISGAIQPTSTRKLLCLTEAAATFGRISGGAA